LQNICSQKGILQESNATLGLPLKEEFTARSIPNEGHFIPAGPRQSDSTALKAVSSPLLGQVTQADNVDDQSGWLSIPAPDASACISYEFPTDPECDKCRRPKILAAASVRSLHGSIGLERCAISDPIPTAAIGLRCLPAKAVFGSVLPRAPAGARSP